jgi:hypothetical protein
MPTMTNLQELPFTLAIKDSLGNDAPVQAGSIVYATSDATIAVVVAAADGMSGVFRSVAASPNPVRMTVTADADLGAGVVTITGVSEDCTVTQDPSTQASAFSFTFGPAQAKA